MSLSERALLLSLTVSQWFGQTTVDVDETKHSGLDPERDSIRHQVVPKDLLREIQQAARFLRREHARLTAPWDDNGLRFIASARLFDYRERVKQAQTNFDTAIDRCMPALEAAIDPAFSQYKQDLRARFGSKLSIYAVPDTGMPALNDIVDAEVRAAMREAITSDVNDRTRAAAKQVGSTLLNAFKRHAAARDRSDYIAMTKYADDIVLLGSTFHTLEPNIPLSSADLTPLETYLNGR